MGPLTRRIMRRRNQVQVTAIAHRARRDARIALALSKDEDRDGGLLIHRAIEQAEGQHA